MSSYRFTGLDLAAELFLHYTLVFGNMEGLLSKVKEYLPPPEAKCVEEACQFLAESDELNLSLEVAEILADLQLDSSSLAAALLHPLAQKLSPEELERRFGEAVRRLLDSLVKLDQLPSPVLSETQAESLRRLFLTLAQDLRVLLISLAEKLCGLRHLKSLPREQRQTLAREAIEVYAPLAHRLGIWQLKWELEDLSFKYLHPEEYREIVQLFDTRRKERERYITHACRILRSKLSEADIEAEVTGRPKNVYSIYNKLKKYADEGKEFSNIHDILALRVLVPEVQDCYHALGVIHSFWHPLPGSFDDYIANPKSNGYRSLHTTVVALEGRPLEIQIRTYEMHRIAEYGVAAHWKYKEGGRRDFAFEEKLAWLRQLLEWQQELSGTLFAEQIQTDFFQDRIYVFTPKGEIKELPRGATPLDFAYQIHTELGHRCIGAKVNGKLVPLNYKLRVGDIVEILATKAERGPSFDWLNPELGYVQTPQAKAKIKQWFRRQERAENIDRAKKHLEKELSRLGISRSHEEIAELFGYDGPEDFLAALGCGDLTPGQVASKLVPREEFPPPAPPKPIEPSPTIQVLGVGDLLVHLASCCHPVPGDDIIGFITRTRGVSIHRRDCPNILNEDEKERLIEVSWGRQTQAYPVSLKVKAWDRMGLIKDLSTVISEAKINIASISSSDCEADATTTIFLTLEVRDVEQLNRLLPKLEGVRGVIKVTRGGS